MVADQLDKIIDLLRVGWHRSIRFPPLRPLPMLKLENGHLTPTPPSATRRLLVGWYAVALWPLHMIGITPQVRHLRLLGSASGTFKPVVGPAGRHRPLLAAVAAAIGLIYLAAVLTAVVTAYTAGWASLVAAVLLLVLVIVPWVAVLVDAGRKRREDPLGLRRLRSLATRATELAVAGGHSFVLTDFVAARDGTGDGVRLIHALAREWAVTGAVVVLYAASEDLVGYYGHVDAQQDIPGHRRMFFDFRSSASTS